MAVPLLCPDKVKEAMQSRQAVGNAGAYPGPDAPR